jgi:receptor protein-tyrosine kinase
VYEPTPDRNERVLGGSALQASATLSDATRYFSLRDILRVFWKRLWIVALVTLVAVGTTVGISLWQTPVYEASATLLLGQEQGEDQLPNLMGSIEGLQQLTHTMVQAVDSRPVAEDVIQRLDLEIGPQQLLDNLSAEQVEDTQFLMLSYADTDPERAQRIVNAVGEVSAERFSESSASAENISVTTWDEATVPSAPVSPNITRNILLALGLGLLLGFALAFLMELLDDTWRSPEELESVSGVPTFGAVPAFELARDKKKEAVDSGLVSLQDPTNITSEAYRMVRTNLLYSVIDNPPKLIVLTSAGSSDGKTTTVANLAVTLAQAGKRTLLLDCDLRRPRVHTVFGARNERGVVNILVNANSVQEVWQEPMPRLKVVYAGPPPPNPAEMLASQRLAGFLSEMKEQFDYVLVDTPPVGYASESAALAANGDGVLVVVDSQNTRKGALRQTLSRLNNVGANVLGTVMNRYQIPKDSVQAYTQYRS